MTAVAVHRARGLRCAPRPAVSAVTFHTTRCFRSTRRAAIAAVALEVDRRAGRSRELTVAAVALEVARRARRTRELAAAAVAREVAGRTVGALERATALLAVERARRAGRAALPRGMRLREHDETGRRWWRGRRRRRGPRGCSGASDARSDGDREHQLNHPVAGVEEHAARSREPRERFTAGTSASTRRRAAPATGTVRRWDFRRVAPS